MKYCHVRSVVPAGMCNLQCLTMCRGYQDSFLRFFVCPESSSLCELDLICPFLPCGKVYLSANSSAVEVGIMNWSNIRKP